MAYIREQHGMFSLSSFWKWTLEISQIHQSTTTQIIIWLSQIHRQCLLKPFLTHSYKKIIKVKTKSIVSEHCDKESKTKKGQYCICIYIFEKISLEKYLYSPMYSDRHITYIYIYIPGIYTMQPLEGCAAYIIKQEGLGVEVCTATTRPSDILENPLPSQKRKGCDICGGLKQLPKLSAHRAHCVLRRNNSWNCFF